MRRRRSTPAHADERWVRITAVVGLAAFVVAVYAVIVVGGDALLGRSGSPSLALSIVATAVVALAFDRVGRWTHDAGARLFHRNGASPYDVLSRFSETVTVGYATDELPVRMVRLLAQGTNAEWAQVWLTVQGRLRLAATWPPGAPAIEVAPQPAPGARDLTAEGLRAVTVRHGGQVYGVFRLQERPGAELSSVEERLFTGLAAQAGLVLRLVGLRADLAARHEELATRARELQASRERLIAAQDDERRRLERDIHDGAQQHLVALAVNLRVVETVAAKDPSRAADILRAQSIAAREAIETLSQLSRGMYPRQLADAGLAAALRAAVVGTAVPVDVIDDCTRLPGDVEAALYFFAMEAVQNAAKHAGGTRISVRLESTDRASRVTVVDDGVGFAATDATSGGGAGLSNMRDRIDAVGGAVSIESTPGGGTRVVATIPVVVRELVS
jgi:signal transduction histidine kinase